MGPDEMDPVVLEIMATLDSLFLAEKQARLQVSALDAQDYPLAATFEMVRDMESDAAIEEALSGFGFEQHTLDDDAELWISDELGLMVSLLLHRTGWPLLHLQDSSGSRWSARMKYLFKNVDTGEKPTYCCFVGCYARCYIL